MRAFFTFLLAFLYAALYAQPIMQKGAAYRYNGKNKRTPLGGVYIKADASENGVVSHEQTGAFTLALNNLRMGDRIGPVRIIKQGMMIFNQLEVDGWSVRKDPLCLILCNVDEFQQQKRTLIAIGESQARKKYEKKLAALQRQNEAQQLQLDIYYNKLDSLQKEYQNALRHMDEYADVFARIDESSVDSVAQRAIELFNRGEIEESLRLLEQQDYLEKIVKANRTIKQADVLINTAGQAKVLAEQDRLKYLEGIKTQIAGYKLQNEWDKAKALLKGLADELNTLETVWEYAAFCQKQNEFKDAETYLLKCQDLLAGREGDGDMADNQWAAVVQMNLASIYGATQRYAESEAMYKAALAAYERLDKEAPSAFEADMATAQENLANLYGITSRYAESESMFRSALKIRKRLAKENPAAFEPGLALTQMNLANLYSLTQRYAESEAMSKAVLEVYGRLARENPSAYEPYLAVAQANLAVLYSNTLRYAESEAMYKAALEVYERLAKENPSAFEPYLALTQMNLGILYRESQRNAESEAMFKAALEIRERLAKEKPAAFEPDLATTQANLAVLYGNTQRYAEGEAMYKAALEIRERLARENPSAFEAALAETQNNLAVLYSFVRRDAESETLYKAALQVYERLAGENPSTFEPPLAGVQNSLALLYSNTQRYAEGEAMYKAALEVYGRLAKEYPSVYEPDLAKTQMNLAILYDSMQRYAESEAMYKSVLEIRQRLAKANPAYEPEVAGTHNNLAVLYYNTRRYAESEAMYKAALEIRERLAVANPAACEPDLAVAQTNLAILYSATQRYAESEALYKAALEIRERLAREYPDYYEPALAAAQLNLAELYCDTQRYAESATMYKACLATYQRLYGRQPEPYEASLIKCYYALGFVLAEQEQNHEAKTYLQQALQLSRHAVQSGKEVQEMWGMLYYLSLIASSGKDYEAAYAYNAELLPLLKKNYEADAEGWKEDYAAALGSHAFYSNLLGRFQAGERHALEALRVDSTGHTACTNLAAALLLQGKVEEAANLYRQYKEACRDSMLEDLAEYERLGVIPEERKADVERIKAMLKEEKGQ